MNPTLLLARGPATRAAHALNDTMKEIATDVRELRAQTNPPPLPTEAVVPESQAPVAGGDEGRPLAEARPAVASGTPIAPPNAAATSEARTAVVSPPVPVREQVTLPPVADVRPELAAFTAAVTQQQQATVQALRQVTELCRSQLMDIKRLSEELGKLDGRLRNLASRP